MFATIDFLEYELERISYLDIRGNAYALQFRRVCKLIHFFTGYINELKKKDIIHASSSHYRGSSHIEIHFRFGLNNM